RTKVSEIAETAVRHVEDAFETPAVVVLTDREGTLVPLLGNAAALLDDDERELMQWAFENGKPAGHATDTRPASQFLFLPLVGSLRPLGVFGVTRSEKRGVLLPAQRELLDTLVAQTALTIERAVLAEEAEQTRLAVETERTRNALLSAVSHD